MEGIFRLSGSNSEIEKYRDLFDQGKKIPYNNIVGRIFINILIIFRRGRGSEHVSRSTYGSLVAQTVFA